MAEGAAHAAKPVPGAVVRAPAARQAPAQAMGARRVFSEPGQAAERSAGACSPRAMIPGAFGDGGRITSRGFLSRLGDSRALERARKAQWSAQPTGMVDAAEVGKVHSTHLGGHRIGLARVPRWAMGATGTSSSESSGIQREDGRDLAAGWQQNSSRVIDVVGKGGGHPLAPEVRKDMEQRLSADVSGVRIRTDAKVAESVETVSADASTVGNEIVFGLVGGIQRKLTVNTPGDADEQEADRAAEQVMRMPEPGAAVTPASSSGPGVQRSCACGGSCAGCTNHQPGNGHAHVQMKAAGPASTGGIEVPPVVHEVLRSPGQPLDAATRAFMEPRFGRDFSRVRIHTDAEAAQSARRLYASAYTVGDHIVFAEKRLACSAPEGNRLLAHELAHVVQQGHRGTPGTHGDGHRLDRKATIEASAWGRGAKLDLDASASFVPRGIARSGPFWAANPQISFVRLEADPGTIKIKAGSRGTLEIAVQSDVFIDNKHVRQFFSFTWDVEATPRGELRISEIGQYIGNPDDSEPGFSIVSPLGTKEGKDYVALSPTFASTTGGTSTSTERSYGFSVGEPVGFQHSTSFGEGKQTSQPPGMPSMTFTLYITVTDTVPEPEPHGKVTIGPIVASSEYRVHFGRDHYKVTDSEKHKLEHWYFNALTEETRTRLRHDLERAEEKLTITGYADDTGSMEYNSDLAAKRVAQVKPIFKTWGVKDKNIDDAALGESQKPGAPGENPSYGTVEPPAKETEDPERRVVVIEVWDQIFAGEAPPADVTPGPGR
jgi:outer membrane protein OmpA-like peptidoglycan-associated protein